MEGRHTDDAGALADFDVVVARYPGFGTAYNERAKTRQKLGDVAGACADWTQAQALGFPGAVNAHARSVSGAEVPQPACP